jgi:hypothetical protein
LMMKRIKSTGPLNASIIFFSKIFLLHSITWEVQNYYFSRKVK